MIKACKTCKSVGFGPSKLGADRCEFCDGTVGGQPPTQHDINDVKQSAPEPHRRASDEG